MSKDVTVGGEPFVLNLQGDSSGHGETQSDLIQALIDQVNAFFGPGDILPTTALVQNLSGSYENIVDDFDLTELGTLTNADPARSAGDYYYITEAGTISGGALDTTIVIAGAFAIYDGSVWAYSTTLTVGIDLSDASTYELITSFQFDANIVRFFEVEYTVIRVSSTEPTIFEVGKIFGLNDPSIIVGNTWSLNVQKMSSSEAGIQFDINSSGQVVYSTNELINYNPADSFINFKAKSIIKEIIT